MKTLLIRIVIVAGIVGYTLGFILGKIIEASQ
jgi:hypothetical protein